MCYAAFRGDPRVLESLLEARGNPSDATKKAHPLAPWCDDGGTFVGRYVFLGHGKWPLWGVPLTYVYPWYLLCSRDSWGL